jgi:hypothetical protein
VTRRGVCVVAVILQFSLVALVCLRELFLIIGEEQTVLPPSWRPAAAKMGSAVSLALGSALRPHQPLRQAVGTYLNAAGIENGYGYFAPAVPDVYKLVFELDYADGHVDYQLPRVASDASGLRVTSLVDYLSRVHDDAVRALIVKLITYSVWRENPEATVIRTHFVRGQLAAAADYRTKPRTYVLLHSYEFHLQDRPRSQQR